MDLLVESLRGGDVPLLLLHFLVVLQGRLVLDLGALVLGLGALLGLGTLRSHQGLVVVSRVVIGQLLLTPYVFLVGFTCKRTIKIAF